MKHILILSRNFPPLIGGMERLMWNAYKELSKTYHCTVIGPSGCKAFIDSKDHAIECHTSLLAFLAYGLLKGFISMNNNKYDLCVSGSGITAPLAVILSKIQKIPSISFVHGLDLIVDSTIYQTFFIPFISRLSLVIANSTNTKNLCLTKGITLKKIVVINPGVDMPLASRTKNNFKDRFNLHNKKILLSVGRLVPRKGLVEFICNCMPSISRKLPECVLVIIGDEANKALLKQPQQKRLIEQATTENGLQQHVLWIGNVTDEVLSSAYTDADLFIFPLKNLPHDIEGFGMVAVEAAAHGVPTIAFNVGGVGDAIVDKKTGWLIETGNYQDMEDKIVSYLSTNTKFDKTTTEDACIGFAETMSWQHFGKRLTKSIDSLLQ